MVSLGKVADFINGYAFKPAHWNAKGKKIIRIQNLTDSTKPYNETDFEVQEKYIVHPGDLLVSWSATLDVFTWNLDECALLNQHIFRVIPDTSKVFKPYLVYALKDVIRTMERYTHGSTMKHINRKEFLETEIYLPPLEHQQHIAAILDKADELRAKRREAVERLEALLQSVFLEMFVERASSDWAMVEVESLAEAGKGKIRTGPFGSQLLHSEFTEDTSGVMVLGIDNVVENRFKYASPRFITHEKYEQLERYRVHPDDVLITIMGTCGRTAIVPEDVPLAINTKHLCCITLDQKKCLPIYLKHCFLLHPLVLEQLGVSERGAVMPGLNMGIIKKLQLPLPSLELQSKYSAIIKELNRRQGVSVESAGKFDTLFSSLQQRAFRGKLTGEARAEVVA